METKKTNWFVRSLIILLSLFIVGLICFNFLWTCPRAQISTGIIILIAFLTILVLSEAFDNFSISQVFSLSKNLKEKESQNKELKKENLDLRNQIVSISSNLSQKQVNSTVILSEELARSLSVKQANEDEKQQSRAEVEEAASISDITDATIVTKNEVPQSKIFKAAQLEKLAFPKFLAQEGLTTFSVIRDVKFTTQFQQIDPVSEYSPIFDGYIKTSESEIFIEMKVKNRSSLLFRERLYLMLSKIYYYKTIKRINAYLYLVLIIDPLNSETAGNILKIIREFEPAITGGLLRIIDVEVTQNELDNLENEI